MEGTHLNEQQVLYSLATRDESDRDQIVSWFSSGPQLGSLARLASQHRVAGGVLQTLRDWVGSEAALDKLLTSAALIQTRQKVLEEELRELAGSGYVPDSSVLLLKGLAVSTYYPDYVPRQMNDVDLVVRDETVFWRLCSWLENRGYEQRVMGVAFPEPQEVGKWYFAFGYSKPIAALYSLTNSDFERLARVDLHYEAVAATHRHFFDYRPIIERARDDRYLANVPRRRSVGSFLVPTPEDCLLALLAETAERTPIARDAVDFAVLTRSCPGTRVDALDWNSLLARIEEQGLIVQFLRLADYYTAISRAALPDRLKEAHKRWSVNYPYWRAISHSILLGYVFPRVARQQGMKVATKHVLLEVGDKLWEGASASRIRPKSRNAFVRYHDTSENQAGFFLLRVAELSGHPSWLAGSRDELLLRTPTGLYLATRGEDFTEEFLEELGSSLSADAVGWHDQK